MAFSEEQVATHKATICDRISNGESLRAICSDAGMPAASTVFLWLDEDATFSEHYARAREAQADALFDEILSIADEEKEDVQRSRLRVDARKWMAGKLKPKKYGDKLELEHGGQVSLVPVINLNAPSSKSD